MSLRVNLYGNVCNSAYAIGKLLRRHGVDARVFVERELSWRPEHEDPELAGGYPGWIEVIGDLRLRRYGAFDAGFVRRLGDCDVIHTFYYGPIWAMRAKRPFVFQNYGGDLSVLPFMTDSVHHRYLAWRQRRGIRAADLVFLTMPNDRYCSEAVTRLGLTRTRFLPLPVDTERFAPLAPARMQRVREAYGREWIFFHPARQSWTEAALPLERKGNDRLFRAFARFVRAGHDAVLVAVRRGRDVDAAERLVEALGIASHVRWLAPVSRHELIELYGMADAVFDQFELGDYGGCAFEAWSCGAPVFMHLAGSRAMVQDPPPAVNVRTEDEIYRALLAYAADRPALRAIGARSREWVMAHLDGDVLMPRYIDAYRSILDGETARTPAASSLGATGPTRRLEA